jgi:fructose-1,6-bisphosphatase/inositol monophosphatase family enzyme
MVAMGKMDMVIEAGLKSWDIEAAIPLIEGAGGSSPTGAENRSARTAARW